MTIPKQFHKLLERACIHALWVARGRGYGNDWFFANLLDMTEDKRALTVMDALHKKPFPANCTTWMSQVSNLIVIVRSIAPKPVPSEIRRAFSYNQFYRNNRECQMDFKSASAFEEYMTFGSICGCEPLMPRELIEICGGSLSAELPNDSALQLYAV